MKPLISLLIFGLCLSFQALAETPYKPSADQFLIEGTARPTMSVSALVFYTPLFNFDKKLSEKDCEFKEDRMKPNGPDRNMTIEGERQPDGSYVLRIPNEGQRGQCPYVIDSMYVHFEERNDNHVVNESINLLTARNIQKSKELADDSGITIDVTDFSELQALYCDFSDEFEYGLCSSANSMIELTYGIANKGTNYRLDVKDALDKPERQY